MMIFQSLFLQCSCTLARASIGTGALTTRWQTAAMAEATIAADVHQTLDVHRGFAAQVTLNGDLLDLLANFFQIAVRQIFDLLGVSDTSCFANLASAGATNAKNGGQTDFRVLVRRNVNASDTCHMRPLILSNQPWRCL